MLAVIESDIVLELPLLLECLLRHVAAGADIQARKSQVRGVVIRRNQIVPILIANGNRVHYIRGENGTQSRIRDDELIGGEIVSR